MATDRQIAANRANAQRSTGPKTAVGKLRSSRNSYRHGLSRALNPVGAIVEAGALTDRFASDYKQALLELQRIRAVRIDMMAKIDLANVEDLRHLAALDRYERACLAKRRRAVRNLAP